MRWRYTLHNGEWWYWLPAGRWVYWRDNRWNDYNPQTFTFLLVLRRAGRIGEVKKSFTSTSDIRPFYGHAHSNLDRRPLIENGEVGPFYGHAADEVLRPLAAVFGGVTVLRPRCLVERLMNLNRATW